MCFDWPTELNGHRGLDSRTPRDVQHYFRDHQNSLNTLGAQQSFLEVLRAVPTIEAGFAKHWAATRAQVRASASVGASVNVRADVDSATAAGMQTPQALHFVSGGLFRLGRFGRTACVPVSPWHDGLGLPASPVSVCLVVDRCCVRRAVRVCRLLPEGCVALRFPGWVA